MSRVDFHDAISPRQARVLFHLERVFRSAGGPGCLAHRDFTAAAVRAYGDAKARNAALWSAEDCDALHGMIEHAARQWRMHVFRDVRRP